MKVDGALLPAIGAKFFALMSALGLIACGSVDLGPYHNNFTAIPIESGQENDAETSDVVTIRFLGNTNFLISDDETSILTDGYFSYPVRTSLGAVFRRIEPDPEAVASATTAPEFKHLAAIIPIHSHYDHAMDIGEVGLRFEKSKIIGSSSTENILRGWRDWKEERTGDKSPSAVLNRFILHEFAENDSEPEWYEYGHFKIAILRARHNPSWLNKKFGSGPIKKPLKPRKTIFSYKEGDAYSVLIKHKSADGTEKTVLIVGSAGVPPDVGDKHALADISADVLLLGAAGMVHRNERHVEYLEKTIDAVDPDVVVPVHWDSIFEPPANGAVMPPAGFYARGAKVDVSMAVLCNDVRAFNIRNPHSPRRFVILPYDRPAPLFSLRLRDDTALKTCPTVSKRWNQGDLRERWE